MRQFVQLVTIFAVGIPMLWSIVTAVKAELKRLKKPLIGWQVWALNLVLAQALGFAYVYVRSSDGAPWPPFGIVALAALFIGLTASGLIDGLKYIGAGPTPPPRE